MDDQLDEYRRLAAECVQVAAKAAPQHRRLIEHIAETWSKLARERQHTLEKQAASGAKPKR